MSTNDQATADLLDQRETENSLDHSESGFSPVLYQFTNSGVNPNLDSVLAMFYEGILSNRIGIMESHNLDSGNVELILVGVEADENDKPVCYPLCKILRSEDVSRYLAPDGKGGFFDMLDPVASAEVRDAMQPLTQITEIEGQ